MSACNVIHVRDSSGLSVISCYYHYRHENASGYYRVSTYFMAKVAVDLISTRLFPLFLFTPIVYFMIGRFAYHIYEEYLLIRYNMYHTIDTLICLILGFQIDVEKFFIFFLTLFLTSFGASAIAFWVSAGVRVAGIGNLLIALSFVFQMVCSI